MKCDENSSEKMRREIPSWVEIRPTPYKLELHSTISVVSFLRDTLFFYENNRHT